MAAGLPPVPKHRASPRANVNLPSLVERRCAGLPILNAGRYLDVELSALQTEGRGEVISNPRVVASNQKEAVIPRPEIGRTRRYRRPEQQRADRAVQEALPFAVTPTITNDGRVFLNMMVTKNEQDGWSTPAVRLQPTIASARSILRCWSTTARPWDGGVYEFADSTTWRRCPGDIRSLGNLFKKKPATSKGRAAGVRDPEGAHTPRSGRTERRT